MYSIPFKEKQLNMRLVKQEQPGKKYSGLVTKPDGLKENSHILLDFNQTLSVKKICRYRTQISSASKPFPFRLRGVECI